MNLSSKLLLSVFLVAITSFLTAEAPAGWTTDFKAAQKQARTENKNLLVNFTGSDWCSWCKRLEKEVFNKPDFRKKASKKYVLVYLDFPRFTKNMSPDLRKQNAALAKRYSVSGYPTVLVLGVDGKVIARSSYNPGGVDAYLANLDEIPKREAAFKKAMSEAEKEEGLIKAQKLDGLLDTVPMKKRSKYMSQMKQIMEIDKDNAAGLRSKYALVVVVGTTFNKAVSKMKVEEAPIIARMKKLQGNKEKKSEYQQLKEKLQQVNQKNGSELVSQLLQIDKEYKFAGTERQEYLGMLARSYFLAQNFDKSITIYKEAIQINPNSREGKSLKSRVELIEPYINQQKKK